MNKAKNLLAQVVKAIFAKEIILLYATRGGAVAAQSLSMFFIAKIIGVAEFGQYSYEYALALLISTGISFGAPGRLLKVLPALEERCKGKGYAGAFYKPFIHSGSFVMLSGAIVLILSDTHYHFELIGLEFSSLFYVALWSTILCFLDINIAILRSFDSAALCMFYRDAAPHLLVFLMYVVAHWIFSISELTSNSVVIAYTCSGGVIFVILFLRVSYFAHKIGFNGSDSKRQYFEFYTYWGSALVGAAFPQYDLLIGKYVLDANDLGWFALCKKIVNLLALPQIIGNWTYAIPIAKSFARNDVSSLQEIANKCLRITVLPSVIFSIGILLASPFWFEYFGVLPNKLHYFCLVILIAGQLFNVASGLNLLFASQCGFEHKVLLSRLIVVLISISILFFFVTSNQVAILSLLVSMGLIGINIYISTLIYIKLHVRTHVRSFELIR